MKGRTRQSTLIYILIFESRCAATTRTIYRAIIFECQASKLSNNSFWRVLFQCRGCILVLIFTFSSSFASFRSYLVFFFNVFGNYVTIIVASVYLWCQYHAMHVTSLSAPNIVNRTYYTFFPCWIRFRRFLKSQTQK